MYTLYNNDKINCQPDNTFLRFHKMMSLEWNGDKSHESRNEAADHVYQIGSNLMYICMGKTIA
jgi:hypothetical protein